MIIVHYIEVDYDDGSLGGVARFDHELKQVFSHYEFVTCTRHRGDVNQWFTQRPEDIVFIVGNDLCLDIPYRYKCIVVGHGSAAEHMEREPSWNGRLYVERQNIMSARPNNYYVAISSYVAEAMKKHLGIRDPHLIVHYSDLEPHSSSTRDKKIVLGDWRNYNKGEKIAKILRDRFKDDFVYKQLECDANNKAEAYAEASMYLTLSLSEGCSYSQMDALACDVPVLSTNVSIFSSGVPREVGHHILDRNDYCNIETVVKETFALRHTFKPRQWYRGVMTKDWWHDNWRQYVHNVHCGDELPHIQVKMASMPQKIQEVFGFIHKDQSV